MKAIALGGGGAKGLAHIGILKALQEEGIEFDIVCGTSIGALVGAFYGAGKLNELEEFALGVKLTDLPALLSPSWSLKGLFSGKSVLEEFSSFLESKKIEDLGVKYGAVSVSLNSGAAVYHTEGELTSAIRASISLPGIFTPVEREEDLLVDGGLVEPVPMQLAKELGATKILAVDLFSSNPQNPITREPKAMGSALSYLAKLPGAETLLKRIGTGSMLDVLEGSQQILQRRLTQLIFQLIHPDYVLEPPVREIGLLDFHIAKQVIECGYKTAHDALPEIKEKFWN